MEKRKVAYTEDKNLVFAAIAYYAVMLVAFVMGLYGLFSLFWLASAEVARSIHVL